MPELKVALSGDCMATRGSLVTAEAEALALRKLLNAADFAVTNLEFVPDCGEGFPVNNAAGGGCLVAGAPAVDETRSLGFTVLSCANNHALDLGPEGVLGTIKLLRDRGIPFAGIGPDLPSARMPAVVDSPSGSLALIACSATFLAGQEASDVSPQIRARPGLNPLRHGMTLRVTGDQLRVLREIDAGTGLRDRRAEAVKLLGIDPVNMSPTELAMFGARFRAGDQPGLSAMCDPADLAEIVQWVRHARQRADVVVVSVHCHEPGSSPDLPAEFLTEFAHRVIDEGADAVMGHGPHFLRGVELYRGRPVFYSLGNIVSQIELGDTIPAEDYAKVPPAERVTPSRYFAARSLNGRRLFAQDRKYWETVIPVLTFTDDGFAGACIYPVELGFGRPPHRRGRPRLIGGGHGADILERFAALSARGTASLELTDGEAGPVAQLNVSS